LLIAGWIIHLRFMIYDVKGAKYLIA